MEKLDINTPSYVTGPDNQKYEVVDSSITEPTNNYYQDAYDLGNTKEPLQIGLEVKTPKQKDGQFQTNNSSLTDKAYTLTFSSSPDGAIWSIGINGLERTFKVGFFGNTTLAYDTIVTEMETWLGSAYIITTGGSSISISRIDGGTITKTEPNLVRNISLTSFDSTSIIDVTVDGVTVSLDGATHSGSATTAITYLKGQLSSSIYYMNSSTSNLIIARKDGAIPVISKTQYNRYTTEIKYQYNDTPNVGQNPEYTTLTVDGTSYVYNYVSASRAYYGDRQVRNFYGWEEEEVGFAISSTTSTTSELGYKFLTKKDCTLKTVKKNASSGATRALLKSSGGTTLATATFSGNVATFNYTLSNATTYQISADNNGSTYTAATNNTGAVTFPEVGEFINYTDAYNSASTFGNIESVNISYAGVNIANKTQSYAKSSGGSDSTWISANSASYFNELHTLGLWKNDYSTISISSVNHYTNPGSFPDDTLYTTITETNHKADITTTTYTEITKTNTLSSNYYFEEVGFIPKRIEFIAKGSGGESFGIWENNEQNCTTKYSSTTENVSGKIFKTDASNYGHIVEVKRGGFIYSKTTTGDIKISYKCT